MSAIALKEETDLSNLSSVPMEAEEHRKMAQVESRLWWYRALHKKILDALTHLSMPKSAPLLDAGCGTGGLLSILSNAGYSNISGFDISPTAVAICQERGFPIKTLGIQDTGKSYGADSFSVIISSDVLCYLTLQEIPDVLRTFHTLLCPGGYIILNLPAYRAFSGIHDKSVGLISRTTERTIRQQLNDAGFEVIELHHWPFILAPMIFLTRLKQRLMLRRNPTCVVQSDIDLPNPLINALLFTLTTTEKLLGNIRFLGSSIFVIARTTKNE
jgi:SAM-dependent methyltransferase